MSNANTFPDSRRKATSEKQNLGLLSFFPTLRSDKEVAANRAKRVILVTLTVNRVMQDLGQYTFFFYKNEVYKKDRLEMS